MIEGNHPELAEEWERIKINREISQVRKMEQPDRTPQSIIAPTDIAFPILTLELMCSFNAERHIPAVQNKKTYPFEEMKWEVKKRGENYEVVEDIIEELPDYWESLGVEEDDGKFVLRPYLRPLKSFYRGYIFQNLEEGEYTYRELHEEFSHLGRFTAMRLFETREENGIRYYKVEETFKDRLFSELNELSTERGKVTAEELKNRLEPEGDESEELYDYLNGTPPEGEPECDLTVLRNIFTPSKEEKKMECPGCGGVIDPDDQFCRHCREEV